MVEKFKFRSLTDKNISSRIKKVYKGSILYRIHQISSGKNYIGYTDNLYNRLYKWKGHVHRVNTKINMREIHKAIVKYGSDDFEFIIELFSNEYGLYKDKESEYIELYDSYYNGYNSTLSGKGGFTKGCKRMTDGENFYYISPKNYSEAISNGLKDSPTKSSIKGKKYLNNGKENITLFPEEIQEFLNKNPDWRLGCLPKTNGYLSFTNGINNTRVNSLDIEKIDLLIKNGYKRGMTRFK